MMWANYLKYVLYDRYAKPDVVLIYQGIADTAPWWPAAYDRLRSTDYWLYRGREARSWSGIQGERKLSQDALLPGLFARSIFLRGAYNERGANENVFANMTRARTVDEAMPDALLDRNVDILGYFVSAVRSDGAVPIFLPSRSAARPESASMAKISPSSSAASTSSTPGTSGMRGTRGSR